MTIEIRVPALGESVSEATIGRWFKKAGEAVKADEPLVELETDKVTLEVNAPSAGVLTEIAAESGTVVKPDALLGAISEGAGAASVPPAAAKPAPAASPAVAPAAMPPSPAAAKIAADNSLDVAAVAGVVLLFQFDDLVVGQVLGGQGVVIVGVAVRLGDVQHVGQLLEGAQLAVAAHHILVQRLGAVLLVPAVVDVGHGSFSGFRQRNGRSRPAVPRRRARNVASTRREVSKPSLN